MLLKLGLETIYFTWNPGIIADNLHNEKREQLIFLGHLRVNMDKYIYNTLLMLVLRMQDRAKIRQLMVMIII